MNERQKYFNFPVQLLEGFMVDSERCLNNIWDFSIYNMAIKMDNGTEVDKVNYVLDKLFHLEGDEDNILKNGRALSNSLPINSPRTGVTVESWFEFYSNYKTDFEKACLLAFLSIKSIIGDKPYCKITNDFFLARMDGKTKSVRDNSELSTEIRKYANEYQTKKIRWELSANWGMSFYAKATKGFYASSKLDIKELTFQVLKTKQTDKYQKVKEAAKNAELIAKSRLGIASP